MLFYPGEYFHHSLLGNAHSRNSRRRHQIEGNKNRVVEKTYY